MSTQRPKERLAESARYALLRRLAPILRHDLAGALQPLIFLSTIIEKRLQNTSPDLAELAIKSSELKTLARVASNECMDLMTWLAPNTGDLVKVAAGVEETIGLIKADLSFKGFTVANEIKDVQVEQPRSLTRNVFAAALVALTDAAKAPATVVVDAQVLNNELVLSISIQPLQGEWQSNELPAYRNLEWEDVQALAEVESVGLIYTADSVKLYSPLSLAISRSNGDVSRLGN